MTSCFAGEKNKTSAQSVITQQSLVSISAPATFNMWLTVVFEKMGRTLLTLIIVVNFVKESTAFWVGKLLSGLKLFTIVCLFQLASNH